MGIIDAYLSQRPTTMLQAWSNKERVRRYHWRSTRFARVKNSLVYALSPSQVVISSSIQPSSSSEVTVSSTTSDRSEPFLVAMP